MLGLLAGCSSDDTGTGSGGNYSPVRFADYDQLISEIAPPQYTAPATAPGDIDPDWNTGSYPLLGKVFSDEEPMSLYRNLDYFEELKTEVEQLLRVDDSTGEYLADSMITVTTLTSPVTIPSVATGVLGSSISVGTLIETEFAGQPTGTINQLAFSKDSTQERILSYFYLPAAGETESSIFYAHHNVADSSVTMKCVFVKFENDGSRHSWVYDIHSVNDEDFAYSMSWYAPDFGDTTGLGAVLGGGNRNTEFALRYRSYRPADSPVIDSVNMLDQVFTGDYAEGSSLLSSYSAYIDESLIFGYSNHPQALLESPFTQ
jgi:hypothetical protein